MLRQNEQNFVQAMLWFATFIGGLIVASQQNSFVFLSHSYSILATNKPIKLEPKGVVQIVLKM